MKNQFFKVFLLCILVISISNAKNINSGTIELGGSTGFSSLSNTMKNTDDYGTIKITTQQTSMNLELSRYFKKNIAIGIIFNNSTSKIKYEVYDTTTDVEINEMSIGPIITYNTNINQNMNFKVKGGVVTISGEENNQKYDGHKWLFGGEINFYLHENISLNGSLLYASGELDYDGTNLDPDIDTFVFGVGLSIYFYPNIHSHKNRFLKRKRKQKYQSIYDSSEPIYESEGSIFEIPEIDEPI